MNLSGNSDYVLFTPAITFKARSTNNQQAAFAILLDNIAQEVMETLTLRLNYDKSLFEPMNNVTFKDELHITITDTEGETTLFITV